MLTADQKHIFKEICLQKELINRSVYFYKADTSKY